MIKSTNQLVWGDLVITSYGKTVAFETFYTVRPHGLAQLLIIKGGVTVLVPKISDFGRFFGEEVKFGASGV